MLSQSIDSFVPCGVLLKLATFWQLRAHVVKRHVQITVVASTESQASATGSLPALLLDSQGPMHLRERELPALEGLTVN